MLPTRVGIDDLVPIDTGRVPNKNDLEKGYWYKLALKALVLCQGKI
jgi:hypothetical protein